MMKVVYQMAHQGEVEVPYSNWSQVGGYFDGDGMVGLKVQMYTIQLYLDFSDNWLPHLDMLKGFISGSGIESYLSGHSNNVHSLRIMSVEGVLAAAKRMLPHVSKKLLELKMVIDYYENRITAQDVVDCFNKEVESGKRTGKVRKTSIPYDYQSGRQVALNQTLGLANEARRVRVPDEIRHQILSEHLLGVGQRKLAKQFGLSRTVVRKVLEVP